MATVKQQQLGGELRTENNALVKTSKQEVMEDGTVVKELYHLTIITQTGTIRLNVGKKTYEDVKAATVK